MSKQTRNYPVDISIVIISWRMRDYLERLLESIIQFTKGVRYELIIVDNNSQDGTAEFLEMAYPHSHIIKNRKNRGVASARNQGFERARGRYVVTLDADMVFTGNSLKEMFDFMENHPEVGICGCKLVGVDGNVQPSARRYPTITALILRRLDFLKAVQMSKALRHHEMWDWDRSDSREVDYVIGACQFIRRRTMDLVGGLDEKIFYGPEDIDYCIRTKASGWKIFYIASTTIIHFEQRYTKRKVFSKLTWEHFKGVLYLYRKHGLHLESASLRNK